MVMTMLSRFALSLAALLGCLRLVAPFAEAGGWPPEDPAEATAKVELDATFAMRLRDIKSFGQLQDAAGARGQITDLVLEGDAPHVIYGWTGARNKGRMRALLYESGDFGAVITPPGGEAEIVLNNFGAFVCASCSPPVNSCGRRPSWVPHDLHWDTFDCGCTLTGPQSLRSGKC
jgi:hypothetical protein